MAYETSGFKIQVFKFHSIGQAEECMAAMLMHQTPLRWLGHVVRMPHDRLLRSFRLVKSGGFTHRATLGLVSMMLHGMIVKLLSW